MKTYDTSRLHVNMFSAPRFIASIFLLSLPACGGGDGRGNDDDDGPPPPLTTAGVSASYKSGDHIERPDLADCPTVEIVWRFTPLQVTGTEGRKTELTIQREYNTEETKRIGRDYWECFYDAGNLASLAVGTWRVSANQQFCEEELNPGSYRFRFSGDYQGCSLGSNYPGD